MNRRTFIGSVLAGFAVATALARTRLEVVKEGEGLFVPHHLRVTEWQEVSVDRAYFVTPNQFVKIWTSGDGKVLFRRIPTEEVYRA